MKFVEQWLKKLVINLEKIRNQVFEDWLSLQEVVTENVTKFSI
jgi:hypothetical protein